MISSKSEVVWSDANSCFSLPFSDKVYDEGNDGGVADDGGVDEPVNGGGVEGVDKGPFQTRKSALKRNLDEKNRPEKSSRERRLDEKFSKMTSAGKESGDNELDDENDDELDDEDDIELDEEELDDELELDEEELDDESVNGGNDGGVADDGGVDELELDEQELDDEWRLDEEEPDDESVNGGSVEGVDKGPLQTRKSALKRNLDEKNQPEKSSRERRLDKKQRPIGSEWLYRSRYYQGIYLKYEGWMKGGTTMHKPHKKSLPKEDEDEEAATEFSYISICKGLRSNQNAENCKKAGKGYRVRSPPHRRRKFIMPLQQKTMRRYKRICRHAERKSQADVISSASVGVDAPSFPAVVSVAAEPKKSDSVPLDKSSVGVGRSGTILMSDLVADGPRSHGFLVSKDQHGNQKSAAQMDGERKRIDHFLSRQSMILDKRVSRVGSGRDVASFAASVFLDNVTQMLPGVLTVVRIDSSWNLSTVPKTDDLVKVGDGGINGGGVGGINESVGSGESNKGVDDGGVHGGIAGGISGRIDNSLLALFFRRWLKFATGFDIVSNNNRSVNDHADGQKKTCAKDFLTDGKSYFGMFPYQNRWYFDKQHFILALYDPSLDKFPSNPPNFSFGVVDDIKGKRARKILMTRMMTTAAIMIALVVMVIMVWMGLLAEVAAGVVATIVTVVGNRDGDAGNSSHGDDSGSHGSNVRNASTLEGNVDTNSPTFLRGDDCVSMDELRPAENLSSEEESSDDESDCDDVNSSLGIHSVSCDGFKIDEDAATVRPSVLGDGGDLLNCSDSSTVCNQSHEENGNFEVDPGCDGDVSDIEPFSEEEFFVVESDCDNVDLSPVVHSVNCNGPELDENAATIRSSFVGADISNHSDFSVCSNQSYQEDFDSNLQIDSGGDGDVSEDGFSSEEGNFRTDLGDDENVLDIGSSSEEESFVVESACGHVDSSPAVHPVSCDGSELEDAVVVCPSFVGGDASDYDNSFIRSNQPYQEDLNGNLQIDPGGGGDVPGDGLEDSSARGDIFGVESRLGNMLAAIDVTESNLHVDLHLHRADDGCVLRGGADDAPADEDSEAGIDDLSMRTNTVVSLKPYLNRVATCVVSRLYGYMNHTWTGLRGGTLGTAVRNEDILENISLDTMMAIRRNTVLHVSSGIKNVGNFCFMNAAIHILFNLRCFRAYAHAEENMVRAFGLIENIGRPDFITNRKFAIQAWGIMIRHTCMATSQFGNNQNNPILPFSIWEAYLRKHFIVKNGHLVQDDSQAALTMILSNLMDAEEVLPDLRDYVKTNCSIRNMFMGVEKRYSKCPKCKKEKEVSCFDINCMSLDFSAIGKTTAVRVCDLIKAQESSEEMEHLDFLCANEDCMYNNKTFNLKIESVSKSHFSSQCLIINLNRADFQDKDTTNKIALMVLIDQYIHIVSNRHPNPTLQYELVAVVIHTGQSANGGHYITFVSTQDGWFKMDDACVTRTSLSSIQKQHGKQLHTLVYQQSLAGIPVTEDHAAAEAFLDYMRDLCDSNSEVKKAKECHESIYREDNVQRVIWPSDLQSRQFSLKANEQWNEFDEQMDRQDWENEDENLRSDCDGLQTGYYESNPLRNSDVEQEKEGGEGGRVLTGRGGGRGRVTGTETGRATASETVRGDGRGGGRGRGGGTGRGAGQKGAESGIRETLDDDIMSIDDDLQQELVIEGSPTAEVRVGVYFMQTSCDVFVSLRIHWFTMRLSCWLFLWLHLMFIVVLIHLFKSKLIAKWSALN